MKDSLKTATFLANLLDNKFKVLGIKFGIDPLLGLLPVGGDVISLLIALYIVLLGIEMKLPNDKILKMVVNIFIDFGVGIVPFLGDIFDISFKANIKNLEILKQHQDKDVIDGDIVW